ncbi:rhomboid family intramembrane serine protease [Kamptonema cortianum]|nr:rhomboid family intramembrane serine protease [Geitlerinema splendidum]MDK3161044.1 rhomboid family intramembrane serine protease [Kamptonema cortianum]
MIPIRDNLKSRETPILVWTLVFLNVVLFLWDRGGRIGGPNISFADLSMVPADVVRAFSTAGDPFDAAKVFTSMFMHGSLAHLVGNLLFLFAFGPGVERALKAPRFTLYFLFWGLVAAAAHIFVNPASEIPTVGASGAIGGVLGAYFLLYPGSQIKVFVPPFFFWLFSVPSWAMLGLWFVWQIVFPQPGVANWAHAGGFMAGMATILVMGGRNAVLAGLAIEEDEDFEE